MATPLWSDNPTALDLLGFTDVMHVPTWIERFNEGLDVADERLKQLAPDGLPIWQD